MTVDRAVGPIPRPGGAVRASVWVLHMVAAYRLEGILEQ